LEARCPSPAGFDSVSGTGQVWHLAIVILLRMWYSRGQWMSGAALERVREIHPQSVLMTTIIQLSDGVVLLRRYRDSDVRTVYNAVRESIPALAPWLAWCHEGYTMEEARQYIQAQDKWWSEGAVYSFAVLHQEMGTFCGGCLLNHVNTGDRFANLAYWVRSSWTGKGIATAAARLVTGFGFEHLGLNRAEIVVAKENVASIRVAEKAGAKREGNLRRRITVRDKVYDAILFSLSLRIL